MAYTCYAYVLFVPSLAPLPSTGKISLFFISFTARHLPLLPVLSEARLRPPHSALVRLILMDVQMPLMGFLNHSDKTERSKGFDYLLSLFTYSEIERSPLA